MSKVKRVPIIISMYLSLIRLDYLLKKHGFEYLFDKYATTYSLMNKTSKWDKNSFNVTNDVVKMVNSVIRFYPLKAECIQRSMLNYKYIRRVAGIEVDMVVGVKKKPFEAHVWIELDGQSLTEPEEAVRDFMIILNSKEGLPK